jgi:hypothetical protein
MKTGFISLQPLLAASRPPDWPSLPDRRQGGTHAVLDISGSLYRDNGHFPMSIIFISDQSVIEGVRWASRGMALKKSPATKERGAGIKEKMSYRFSPQSHWSAGAPGSLPGPPGGAQPLQSQPQPLCPCICRKSLRPTKRAQRKTITAMMMFCHIAGDFLVSIVSQAPYRPPIGRRATFGTIILILGLFQRPCLQNARFLLAESRCPVFTSSAGKEDRTDLEDRGRQKKGEQTVERHGKKPPFPGTGFTHDADYSDQAGRVEHDEDHQGQG